jgi:hypothetical protein
VPGNIRERIPRFEPDDRQPANDVFSSCNRELVSLDLLFAMAWKRRRCQNTFHGSTAGEREDEYA